MVVLFNGKRMSVQEWAESHTLILTSQEAKRLADNLAEAAEEADDHDAYELVLMAEERPIALKFHITGKNVKASP